MKRAIDEGWDSPQKSIEGGAEWISNNYINATVGSASASGIQNTLYKMKWDIARIEAQGANTTWLHQYATSLTWCEGISRVMSNCYDKMGITVYDTGFRFEIPAYAVAE